MHSDKSNMDSEYVDPIYFDQYRVYLINKLNEAALKGDLAQFNVLLTQMNVRDDIQEIPLISAIKGRNCEILKLILDAGADVFQESGHDSISPLGYALKFNDYESTQLLMSYMKRKLNSMNSHSKLLEFLPTALKYSDAKIVKLFLEEGLDVKSQDGNGNTPLMLSLAIGCLFSRHNAVLLLEMGSDPNHQNCDGITPLMLAASQPLSGTLELLLKLNVDIHCQDRNGRTPLIFAAANGRHKSARLLLDKGADMNHKSNDGTTPLMAAMNTCYIAVIKLLIEKGANVEQFSKENFQCILLRATLHGYFDLVEVCLKNGANLDYKYKYRSENEETLLMLAIKYSSVETVLALIKLLLRKGVSLDHKGSHGQTALEIAEMYQRSTTSDTLRIIQLLAQSLVVQRVVQCICLEHSKNAPSTQHEDNKQVVEVGASLDHQVGAGEIPYTGDVLAIDAQQKREVTYLDDDNIVSTQTTDVHEVVPVDAKKSESGCVFK